jgi:hypothetical protein
MPESSAEKQALDHCICIADVVLVFKAYIFLRELLPDSLKLRF